MQSWLTANLEVLGRRDPALAAVLSAKSGLSGVLPSPAAAEAVARFWAQQKLQYPLLLVCYGADTGCHLRHYFSHPNPATRHTVVIERSVETFRHMLDLHDWRDVLADPQVDWVIGKSPEDIALWCYDYMQQDAKVCLAGHMENVIWLPSVQRDGAYYVAAAQAVARGTSRLVNSLRGSPEDQFRGLLNMVDNQAHLATLNRFDQLRATFSGRPGIVVATGPSLNCALPHLAKVQDRAVLFAVDSAVSVLHGAGITPHFIACLERVVATACLLEGLPRLASWLVALPVVHRQMFRAHAGSQLLMFSRGLHYSWLFGDVPLCALGPSSATMAFAGLQLLGCDPIILVGQDLAFDRHSPRSHAEGAVPFIQSVGAAQRQEVEQVNDPANLVPGNDGRPIQTWEPYRVIAEQMDMLMQQSGRRCLNAIPAGYGMRLTHAERVEPRELSALCPEPFDVPGSVAAKIASVPPLVSPQAMQTRMVAAVEQLGALRDFALGVLEECSAFWHEHLPSLCTPELQLAYKQQFGRIEQQINQVIGRPVFQEMLLPLFMPIHVRIMMQYFDILAKREPFEKRLAPSWRALNEWFEELYVWSDRCTHLLSSGAPGSRAVA